MKTYNLNSNEIAICGVNYDGNGNFWRLPKEVAEAGANVLGQNHLTIGGRVRFNTNAPRIKVKMTIKEQVVDWAIPISGSASADVFVGNGEKARWAGIISPKSYDKTEGELEIHKSSDFENVTINLTRNHPITSMEISVDDEYILRSPNPYTISTPIVFYGSSITAGGCATSVGSAYTSLVCRWLDADYINLGFSNGARGEQPIADYIAGLNMSAFVLDYDHNAYDFELLKSTHEKFFKTIRNANPNLPILILTRPDFTPEKNKNIERINLIKQTYLNAKAAGDNNVYVISGDTFFEGYDNGLCTVENCHPNDLGFMLMAKKVYPVLKQMLGVE